MFRLTSFSKARAADGFTLIEVVVTLAVIAVILTSIGSLVSAAVRGTHALDDHLVLVETARAIEAALPDRDALKVGTMSGVRDGQAWRVDVRPFAGQVDAQAQTQWLPLAVAITVQTPGGTSFSFSTVRLGRKPAG